MKRFENYGLWVSIFALLSLILQDSFPLFDTARYNLYVDCFLTILITAGIINNPTVGKWYKDEEGGK